MPQNDDLLDADSLLDVWLSHQPDVSRRSFEPRLARIRERQKDELRSLERDLRWARQNDDASEARHLESRIEDRKTIHELSLDREMRDCEMRISQEKARRSSVCRDFAAWSKTPDGKHFLRWSTAANSFYEIVTNLSDDWNKAYRREAREFVDPEEQEQHDRGQWIEKPRFSQLFWTLIAIAILTFSLAATLALILSDYGAEKLDFLGPVTAILFYGSLFVAAIVGYKDKTSQKWKDQNQVAGHAAAQSRIDRFGFDPCAAHSTPPSIWRDSADATARSILKEVLSGIERHPSPTALSPLDTPTLKMPEEIVFPPMRAKLARIRNEFETRMPEIL